MNPLHTSQGSTHVSESVVEQVAGIALERVPGIHALGGTVERTFGFLLKIINLAPSIKQGVTAAYEHGQLTLHLALVVAPEYSPYSVAGTAGNCVIDEVERLTGIPVARIEVEVLDVADSKDEDASRQDAPSHSPADPQAGEVTVDERVLITCSSGTMQQVVAGIVAPVYGVAAAQVKVRVTERGEGLGLVVRTALSQQVLGESLELEEGSEALTRAIDDHVKQTSPGISRSVQQHLGQPVDSLEFEITRVDDEHCASVRGSA